MDSDWVRCGDAFESDNAHRNGCRYGTRQWRRSNAAAVGGCINLKDGTDTWSERLFSGAGKIFASAIGTRDRVYFFSESGEGSVIATDPAKVTVISRNKLDSGLTSSPVTADGALFLRTKTHLYKIVKK